ncbi:DUF4440 domain-containing protein [Thioclava sp. SK-1]|uniref:DUF4440 domain-containing protein n=1 Tax=Thioclava sp. SK-1 TaxID=1889770 RepID=UPI000826B1AC|nr:DUF4440 domain-containing protein [Thioclava sp. SK-1]OCX66051.1 DUF4440 domain-containing protein [Thioclava sp. SK-1]
MSLSHPDDLSHVFAKAWGGRDAVTLAGLFAPDADFLSLTGGLASGQQNIAELLAGEFSGAFSRARLVTGKCKLRPVGQQAVVMQQRFVLSGLIHADGSDAGRVGAIFCATLGMNDHGWEIVAAQFVPEA